MESQWTARVFGLIVPPRQPVLDATWVEICASHTMIGQLCSKIVHELEVIDLISVPALQDQYSMAFLISDH
jgi:hypothetical protein